ncbi:helix-turn-helix transcriptional regulator [Nocardia sp. CA2R105]|uniref:helix-turn-helix transcriptional regulator n=1 Tax=Nocardia coffeae TaxID=2873381 RepID=UPI001CA68BED|nr:helix-turn-helix transcriptional regulator [Nocardia coffeae]MBY8863844.1 helix-turn-helix transcriptional regulator [Nocardia coffeae]
MSEFAELGPLLRGWRERVTPQDVGLSPGPGRRVVGLRRQEVARLAGVSPDYLTQLEQGRGSVPSAQVLMALARALRLSAFERDHLLRLAGYGPRVEHRAAPTPEMQRLVTQLGVVPAAVYDEYWNPIAWNPQWAQVNGDPASRPHIERNMLWRLMTGLPIRAQRPPSDTREVQKVIVGDLRAALGQHGRNDQHDLFIADLSLHSTAFRELWTLQHVDNYKHDTKAIRHPDVGILHVDCDILDTGSDGHRLIMYTAADRSATSDRLQQLHEQPPAATQRERTA